MPSEHRFTPETCPSDHTAGMAYDPERDLMVCPLCDEEQYEEMGG